MKKKIILLTLIIISSLILVAMISNVLLINNYTTYKSKLTIDKENKVLYTNTTEEIKVLQISDVQIDKYMDMFYGFVQIKRVIKKTSPDLIILTGDNIDNQADESYVRRLAAFMDSFEIPWAPIYGNHDHWADVSIKRQNEVYAEYKHCLFDKGDVPNSNGNYYYTIKRDNETIYSVILMDSRETGFTIDHTSWYESVVNKINQENNKIVPNMVFCHIPIPEITEAYDDFLLDNSIGSGFIREPLTPQEENFGIFDKMVELQSTKVVGYGHDHVNTVHVKYKGISLCYGLKIGYSSYYDKDIQGGSLYTIKPNNEIEIEKIFI